MRLVQSADGRPLWAGQHDEQLTRIFDIKDAISERVTRELTLRFPAARPDFARWEGEVSDPEA